MRSNLERKKVDYQLLFGWSVNVHANNKESGHPQDCSANLMFVAYMKGLNSSDIKSWKHVLSKYFTFHHRLFPVSLASSLSEESLQQP